MSVAYDNSVVTNGGIGIVATTTVAMAVGNIVNGVLFVDILSNSLTPFVSGVTFNGVAMTQVGYISRGTSGSGRGVYTYVLSNVGGNLAVNGTYNIVVTWSSSIAIANIAWVSTVPGECMAAAGSCASLWI